MAKFRDFSEYKNNILKLYFLENALKNYALEKEKRENEKPKLSDNLIFTTLFTYLITEIDYLQNIKNNCLTLFLLIVIVIYILLIVIYHIAVFPMYKRFVKWYESYKFNKTTNTDNFKTAEQRTEKAYRNAFKHDISDQIAIALDITSRIKNETGDKFENHFYTNEAFDALQESMKNLFDLLESNDFKSKQGDNFEVIKKHQITELVPLVENITEKISDLWKKHGCLKDHENELKKHNEYIRLIKKTYD